MRWSGVSVASRFAKVRELVGSLWRERRPALLVVLLPTFAAGLLLILTGLAEYIVAALVVAVLAIGLYAIDRRRRRTGSLPTAAHVVGAFAAAAVGTVLAIQVVPYGQPQEYPAGSGEPKWANERTRELMVQACYACHSNEVTYPWYSRVAPISWTVQGHINSGQRAVNYSDFATDPAEANETVKVVREGSMPPSYFTMFGRNPEARLTPEQVQELVRGLQATPGMGE